MARICTLGGTEHGRLELEVIERVDRHRSIARLRIVARPWDAVRDAWSRWDQESVLLERMLLRTDALLGFADALAAWADLPLDRLRVASLTHEAELAHGWPERVAIAVGPLPRYRLGDRVLLKARTTAGGRESLLAFDLDVSGAAVFVEDVDDAMNRPPR